MQVAFATQTEHIWILNIPSPWQSMKRANAFAMLIDKKTSPSPSFLFKLEPTTTVSHHEEETDGKKEERKKMRFLLFIRHITVIKEFSACRDHHWARGGGGWHFLTGVCFFGGGREGVFRGKPLPILFRRRRPPDNSLCACQSLACGNGARKCDHSIRKF